MHALFPCCLGAAALALIGCGDAAGGASQPKSVVTTEATSTSEPPLPEHHDPLPEDLLNAMRRGDVVAIVGAGFSMSAGLPGFWSFLSDIAKAAGREDMVDKEWESLDQFQFALAEALGRSQLCELMRAELKAPEPLPDAYLANARALAALPVCAITSFNWDPLFRNEYNSSEWPGTDFSSLCLAAAHQSSPLLEIQGSVSNCDSLIVSEDDYARVREQRTDFFTSLLSTATALYIGMSVTDGYPLMKGTGPWPKKHFAIVNDLADEDRSVLESQGITPIVFYNASQTNFVGMTHILEELGKLSQQHPPLFL